MPYILENETKIISILPKMEKQTKSRFQTKLRLENCLFVQKLQGKFFLKLTIPEELRNCNSDLCHWPNFLRK